MHDGSAPEEDIRREIAVASERWRLVLSAPGVQAGKRFPPARPNGRGSWAPALAPAPAAEAVATPVKIPDGPAAEVVHRLRFDESIKAAAARVEAADRVLAAAVTDEAFGRAAGALDVAVSRLEQIGGCARRCAAVAAFLGKPPETLSSPGSVAGKGDASLDDARSPATQGAGEEGGLGEVEEIVD